MVLYSIIQGDNKMIENLIAVFAVLLTISFAAERLIEVFKPLFEKIAHPTWQSSTKLLTAILIGTACAFLLEFNLFWKLGVASVANIVGYLFAGLIASTGSTTINRLLEWLKTLRKDVVAG
jgi:flagellar biosynthesis protein FlhB